MEPDLKLVRIISMPFEENTYVVHLAGRTDCLVIDPGLEPEQIVEYLDGKALEPAAILNTHGHSDHIAGNGLLKKRWPDCPLVIGTADAPCLLDPQLNLSAPFGMELVSPPADVTVDDGQTFSAAGFDLEILGIPGHSSGHVVYLCRQRTPYLAFVGDVIFAGSIGRTDLPDGSYPDLIEGIHHKLFTLPDDTQLYSGHGPATTVGKERRYNPFVGEQGSGR